MLTMKSINSPLLLLTLCGNLVSLSASDWPIYRGAKQTGVSDEKGWFAAWPETGPRTLWKASVGTGFNIVSVSNGKLFTMGNAADTDTVYCLDAATGKELWKFSYPCKLDPNMFEGGPTATPTVDGNTVYTSSRYGHIFALDAATGKELWKKHLMQDFGMARPAWGFSGSVLAEGNLVFINAGDAGLALDKATGNKVWQNGKSAGGYSTPVAATYDGTRTVVLFGAKTVTAVAMADGKKVWEFEWKTSYDVNAADPILAGNQVFVSSGYNRGCALFEVKGGQATKVWENANMRNHFANCVLVEKHIYGFDGNTGGGSLKCLDLATGSVKWSQSGMTTGGLMAADGKLVILADKGKLVIAEANPEAFKQLASAQVLTGKCWTMPVLSNGRIYCRNAKGDLVCVAAK
jgi:outer membrane protein assembly factor BamB